MPVEHIPRLTNPSELPLESRAPAGYPSRVAATWYMYGKSLSGHTNIIHIAIRGHGLIQIHFALVSAWYKTRDSIHHEKQTWNIGQNFMTILISPELTR